MYQTNENSKVSKDLKIKWNINSHLLYTDQYSLEGSYFWDNRKDAPMEDEHTVLTHFYTSKSSNDLHPLISQFTLM